MHKKSDGLYQRTNLTTKTIPQRKEREGERRKPVHCGTSITDQRYFSSTEKIGRAEEQEKSTITCCKHPLGCSFSYCNMSGQKVKKDSKSGIAANGSVSVTVKKAFVSNSIWEDKDEFLDVIYWFRQVLAILLGIIWGILPLKGILAIGLFALLNAGILYIYFTNFQKIDDEEYGGPWELTKEGFMTSFALFLVVWIICYSAVHFP